MLLIKLWPDAPKEAILYSLTHDIPEQDLGDLPPGAKFGSLALAYGEAEAELMPYQCDADWSGQIKMCDRLDAYLWAKNHDPSILAEIEWQVARAIIEHAARKFGQDIMLQVESMDRATEWGLA